MDVDFAGKIDKDKPKQQNINKNKKLQYNNRKSIQRRVKFKNIVKFTIRMDTTQKNASLIL